MTHPILELENITAYRKDTRVFDGFNLNIYAGEHIAILGPNGSGKTTLLKLLTRDISPVVKDNSSIRIFGEQLVNIWQLRERIGLVSHDFQMHYDTLGTGLDVVVSAFFGSTGLHGHQHPSPEQIAQAEAKLHEFRIYELRDKMFLKLSTGQQRRLLLARACVHSPEVIVFDEPTAGLDVAASFKIIDDMRKLSKQGVSLILVTHHIQEIIPEINRVVLLKEGKLVFDGSKEQGLTAERLNTLFDTSLNIHQTHDHFYYWTPTDTLA